MAIRGKVVSSKFLRPNVSMVHMAGKAKTKLIAPKPNEASRAWISLKLASVKMFACIEQRQLLKHRYRNEILTE